MMCRQHQLNYHMDIVIPRLFIHVGPDHPPVTALQNFAMQLAAIKLGLQESVMKVGNLDTSRDFVDVRDGAKALWILAQKGQSGQVYNQCSGKAWSIRKSLEILIDISGMDVKVTQDRRLMRLSDEKILLGDPSKLESLGWKSSIPFRKTLEDIFENWIDRLSDSSTCTERQSHKLR
jgi:GDP-4-dehydro-6-deoxy-D-mannose reductase